jgi:hypothetical protein
VQPYRLEIKCSPRKNAPTTVAAHASRARDRTAVGVNAVDEDGSPFVGLLRVLEPG